MGIDLKIGMRLQIVADYALSFLGRETAYGVNDRATGLHECSGVTEHPGLQDRFISAGRVTPELADRLGLCGLSGRASGMSWDLRVQFPPVPYDALDVRMATHRNGDVAARVTVRFEEVQESLDLCAAILDRLPRGGVRDDLPVPLEGNIGLGWVEGWRGEVLIALEVGLDGSLRRVHTHDPSWHNWPLLEHAVMDNIVPDFPLINKSFNLSYSGVDL